MKFTRAKPYASVVITFLFNVEFSLISNLIVRNLIPFLTTESTNLNFKFENGRILVPFIMINSYQVHDIKWMIFLNGPIFVLGSYFYAAHLRDDALRLDPYTDVQNSV